MGSADIRVDSTAQIVRRDEIVRNSDCLWVNKDGVPIPSSSGMTIKLYLPTYVMASSMAQVMEVSAEEVSYRGERCTSFNVEVFSAVHIRFSSSSGISL